VLALARQRQGLLTEPLSIPDEYRQSTYLDSLPNKMTKAVFIGDFCYSTARVVCISGNDYFQQVVIL
jgi:hypothetical protein